MDQVERLVAIEEIKRLKARYFRCVDTKDWDSLAELFAADGTFVTAGRPDLPLHGPEEIIGFLRLAMEHVVSIHHGHMPEIDITSPTTASAIWAMNDVLRWTVPSELSELRGWGHYTETYERVDGVWRIKTSVLTKLRVDTVPGAGATEEGPPAVT
jgi:hypothetical protein